MKTSWAKNPQFMIENRAGMTEFFISHEEFRRFHEEQRGPNKKQEMWQLQPNRLKRGKLPLSEEVQ